MENKHNLIPRRSRTASLGKAASGFLLLCTLALAQAAAPPAGAPIGNQATATYKDAGDNLRTTTSNQVVTYVAQVAGLVLESDQTKLAGPGTQVAFPHTLQNTGNGADNFDLTWAHANGFNLGSVEIYIDADGNGIPDNATPITNTGEIPAGGYFKFVVVGTVPGSAIEGATSSGTITATSLFDNTVTTLNTDVVNVTESNPVINVTKTMNPTSGASPSTGHTVTFTYVNSGNSAATDLSITDVLPVGMSYAGSARWSLTGSTDLTPGTPANAAGNSILITQTGQTFTALIGSVAPGESRIVSFNVDIDANVAAGVLVNTATFAYNNPDSSPSTGATNAVNFTVNASAGVTIVSNGPLASAPQGGAAVFTNTVTNTGNAPDSFDITFDAGHTYPVGTTFQLFKADGNSPLLDTNGNGIPDTGLIAPGATYAVIVKAILPSGSVVAAGPYSVTKRATSKNDPTATATTQDVLTAITLNTVDLTNDESLAANPAAPGAGSTGTTVVKTNNAKPGETTRFVLFVNNTGVASDSYNLAAANVPAGFTVVFRDAGTGSPVSGTGLILVDGSKEIWADVTIPAGQAPGLVNIDFQALSPVSGATDVIRDTIDVAIARAISITPNHSGQIYPGGVATYNHTLTNNGNVNEGGAASTIDLGLANSLAGWNSVVYLDVNGDGVIDANDVLINSASDLPGIAPGSSLSLIVKVSAPPGAVTGQTNATTLTATTTGGTGTVPAPVSVTDVSTVLSSDLVLLKEQALDVNGDGTNLTYTTAPIANAAPGSIIRYRLTIVNNGSAEATDVKIHDTIPAFSAYTISGAAAQVSQGTLTVPVTLNEGYASELEFTVGTLQPGQSAIATFGVKIDQ